MHYVCHRSENKHSTASAPLAYPWRHCLSCLYVGPVAWSWWSCWLFVASPGRNRRQWSIRCLYSQISFLLTVVFHSIKLPINSQPDIQKHKETERERERVRKREVMPFTVRTVRWDWERKSGRLCSFLPCWQVEQVVIFRLSVDHIIPHVSGKIKPPHTNTNRGNIVTVLSASLLSIVQIS